MCGIVGYLGKKKASEVILNGLTLLEYRGYDSAGMALVEEKTREVSIFKDKGRVGHLCDIVDKDIESHLGIGHTRWATHGVPNKTNSHPHYSENKRFTIVHNGVIENYKKLKREYLEGYEFRSETDTEVIVNLIQNFSYDLDTDLAIRKTLSLLEGSYAILIIDSTKPNTIYAAKNKSPLVIGRGVEGITIASDVMALVSYCNEFFHLEDRSFVVINEESISVMDIVGVNIDFNYQPLKLKEDEITKGAFPHYMLKEINEQPGVIRRLISTYFDEENILIDEELISEMRNSDCIYIVGCGTSSYAGKVGKFYFENLCKKQTNVYIASEAQCIQPFLTEKPFYIFISQSGETADSIGCLKKVKALHIKTLVITNVIESTLGRMADYVLDICAGKEIAVASTKAYTAQVVILSILARAVSGAKTNLKVNLSKASLAIEEIINNGDMIDLIAEKIKDCHDAFYIGRGLDYYSSLEMALKLKEISYIHTEAYPSGELKHGSIALIEEGFPVIAVMTQDETATLVRANLEETVTRGALPITVCFDRIANPEDDFVIPGVASYLTPIVVVVFGQLLSYYVSVKRGNDVDKPKNLAKSVTVQ